MKTINVLAHVDERHRLSADVPADVPPGPVKVVVLLPEAPAEEDEAGAAWMAGICREWAAELNDPREDVYTIHDGKPIDESR